MGFKGSFVVTIIGPLAPVANRIITCIKSVCINHDTSHVQALRNQAPAAYDLFQVQFDFIL